MMRLMLIFRQKSRDVINTLHCKINKILTAAFGDAFAVVAKYSSLCDGRIIDLRFSKRNCFKFIF